MADKTIQRVFVKNLKLFGPMKTELQAKEFGQFSIMLYRKMGWLASFQSAENRRKECDRFWLRLRHTRIPISNDRTSASKKINPMVLIRTLTVPTIASERKEKEFYGLGRLLLPTNMAATI